MPRSPKQKELIEFVASYASAGNQAGTIASKLSVMLHFHRINLQMELPTSSPLIKRALKGVTRSHVAAGTPKKVRRPISWDALLEGQGLASSWGPGGRVLWLSLALNYFFRGKVGRNLCLAGRSGAPRALLDDERRGAIQVGAAVDFVAVASSHQR